MGQRLWVVSAVAEPPPHRVREPLARPPVGARELPSLPMWAELQGQICYLQIHLPGLKPSALVTLLFWCHQQVRPCSLMIWIVFPQKCWEKVSVWQGIWPRHEMKFQGKEMESPIWGLRGEREGKA